MLLGGREHVDRETNEAFMETGTVHILCVAGLHVGILAWLLFLVLRIGWLPRRTALAGRDGHHRHLHAGHPRGTAGDSRHDFGLDCLRGPVVRPARALA